VPVFDLKPLVVTCQSCGATAETWDFQRPDRAVECPCCPVAHDHGAAAAACPMDHDGPCARENPGCTVCRPVTITATAHLTLFDAAELLDSPAASPSPPVQIAEV